MVDLTKRGAVYIGYLSELQNESREAIAFMKSFQTEASGITTYGEMPGIEQMNLPEEAKSNHECTAEHL